MSTILTAVQIMNMAERVEYFRSRPGCYILRPPVPLVHKETGKTVAIESVDLTGKYKGTVHSHDLGFWRSPDQFELPASN